MNEKKSHVTIIPTQAQLQVKWLLERAEWITRQRLGNEHTQADVYAVAELLEREENTRAFREFGLRLLERLGGQIEGFTTKPPRGKP